jgi:hypothetical protein
MDFLSTTALANEFDMSRDELFDKLESLGWIERKNNKWSLSAKGKQNGGQTRKTQNGEEYIVWPENISIVESGKYQKSKLLTATIVGKHFNVSSQRINLILSELGWIEKEIAGWELTKLGKNVGGRQFEHETSGGFYVMWPENILTNKSLVSVFKENTPDKTANKTADSSISQPEVKSSIIGSIREKYEATHRTRDGHYVRSRAEVIIDDTLYDYGLVHAYEKKVPIEEDLYTDFYLPNGKVYIEFWGLENDPKYLERKKVKKDIYDKYDLKLIELSDSDILNLDDHLPKKLLKFGIKVYN